jgi:hypothetical protein
MKALLIVFLFSVALVGCTKKTGDSPKAGDSTSAPAPTGGALASMPTTTVTPPAAADQPIRIQMTPYMGMMNDAVFYLSAYDRTKIKLIIMLDPNADTISYYSGNTIEYLFSAKDPTKPATVMIYPQYFDGTSYLPFNTIYSAPPGNVPTNNNFMSGVYNNGAVNPYFAGVAVGDEVFLTP